ncbi:50S ribosomal protein L19 [Omnitrophica bacterium]|nr:50S ribosomal protein L19 [Candidatus Omnitrophota bacterium]
MNKEKIIRGYENSYMKKELPKFNIGDTVDVHVKIVEEGKKRIQVFTGTVMKMKGSGARRTFTVRKVSFSEGVERTFPIHSPNVERIVVSKKGNVKRAKLYYLREKIGRKTKIEGEELYGDKTPSSDAAPRKEGEKKGI